MEKMKVYEISVIDKTYSKIMSDETKFYTSDTALELIFKLKETEYTFESAEIVLLNVDDRSLVTRPVAKNLGSFTYELDDDITARYGEWHGQLRFEQAGEIYVSSPVKFRIENDLSNDRPPQLSDVQSWASLKLYADSLTEELKQVVLSVEGIEDSFNANELERQTTFEANESERDGTFIANESARQTIFDENEAIRTKTFNTNEATRQENESVRQQAETQRSTAESSRTSAEEQRKIDHASRSDELASKANKQQEPWITPTLMNGWVLHDVAPKYMKDEMGFVHLKGNLKSGPLYTTIFTLPVGYRPNSETIRVPLGGDAYGRATIVQSGALSITVGSGVFALDGITFRAEA